MQCVLVAKFILTFGETRGGDFNFLYCYAQPLFVSNRVQDSDSARNINRS